MSNAVAMQPFIPLSEPCLEGNTWNYVKDALDSGWVSSVGPYVTRFEQEMAYYFNVERTVATVNGTAALHIALLLAGVQPGDEVIVPSLTFISSINVIRYVQATPVFWDSQATHWNADPAKLEALITPKTKAIITVHLYGHPMNMEPVLDVAARHNLKVIEDAAEAMGAYWQGQPCGRIGTIGCLSFNGNKTMTTGGGGLIISQNTALMERAHYLINQAKDDALTFSHDEVGYNYRLTNVQAAMGVAQLEQVSRFVQNRQDIARRYSEAFVGHPALLRFAPPADAISSDWLYGVALNPEAVPGYTAMDMVKALNDQQIQSRPFFKPGHLQKPFQPFAQHPCPNAEHWQRYGFNLPSSSTLMPDQQTRVIQSVMDVLDQWIGQA